ncbi:uncharacterized protein BT62DRAFT_1007027 [Guyanagaster necrorhizus]|uniref:Uncharacterized protein n=1 Tax=Guyanagaster necrorhizus TaxID=856835 RepID=A0A9P7VRV0_9AGAR|nr:uncharacterized protein BT62DRAFT_1007027 [Guyanagaster necrorhizus MCA 3950]KAG7445320.1 hypothetical protein BT62DRAFT_1007027 [Guyanagaster necrorhizus MCA 3950]
MAHQPESTTSSEKSLSSRLFNKINFSLGAPPQSLPVCHSSPSPPPVADNGSETSNTSDASSESSSMVWNPSPPPFPPSLVEVADAEVEMLSASEQSYSTPSSTIYYQPYHPRILSPIPEGGSIFDDEPCYPPDEESTLDEPPNVDETPPSPLPKKNPPVPPRGDIVSCLLPLTLSAGSTASVPPGYLRICGRTAPTPRDRPPFEGPPSPSSCKGIIDFPYDFPTDDTPRSASPFGRSDSELSRNSSSTDEVQSDSKVSTGRWKRLFRSRKSSKPSVPPPACLPESPTLVVSEFGAVESAESLPNDEKQPSLGRNVLKKAPKKPANLEVPTKSEAKSVTKVSRKFPALLTINSAAWFSDSASGNEAQLSIFPADGSPPPTPLLSAHDLGKVNAFYAPVPILPPSPRPPMTPKLPTTPQVPTTPDPPSTPNIPLTPRLLYPPNTISSYKSTPSLRTARSADTDSSKSLHSAHSSKSTRTVPPPKPAPTYEPPPTPTSKEDKRNTIYFVIEPEWDQNPDEDVPFQLVPREAVPTGERTACLDVFSARMSLRPRSVSDPEFLAASVAKSLASVVEGAGY